MTNKIDCRGLACPEPVMQTKKSVDQGNPVVRILVDNDAAVENVGRFLTFQGYQVSVDSRAEGTLVEGIKEISQDQPAGQVAEIPPADGGDTRKIVVMIGSRTIGNGDDLLGEKLMISYIKTLKEMGNELWRLIFVNGGVHFAVDGSALLQDLLALEAEGTTVLVCGTCLNHFNILEKKKVGQTTNMLDIVTAMQLADKVISL